jgi:hypothetical protein
MIRPAALLLFLTLISFVQAQQSLPNYEVQLDVISSGFDKETCWVHPRAGTIPGPQPIVVLTMQKLLLTGSDVFYALNEMRTDDLGTQWSKPNEHSDTLGRRGTPPDTVVNICDFTPRWHSKTGVLLGTGQTVRYQKNRVMHVRNRETAYSTYNPTNRTWSDWSILKMPDTPEFQDCGAGSVQRHDLPNGDVLLPVYYKAKHKKQYSTTVVRCGFDGSRLTYKEHGSSHTVPVDRGLYEPSVIRFQNRYFLTLRNDRAGYVTHGSDGLQYEPARKWTFDDGTDLGSYNTQQHWVSHDDTLFLVYTRRGANNDHVFRHRAPLFMAQVDPDRLCVLRDTERIIVPEKGARLGNFAVTQVTENETWITVAEWMQTKGPNPHDFSIPMKHGSNNRVYVARLKWQAPPDSQRPHSTICP